MYLIPAGNQIGEGISALRIILLVRGIVLSGRIVIFVLESVVTGFAIGQTLLESRKGVGQAGPLTVGE